MGNVWLRWRYAPPLTTLAAAAAAAAATAGAMATLALCCRCPWWWYAGASKKGGDDGLMVGDVKAMLAPSAKALEMDANGLCEGPPMVSLKSAGGLSDFMRLGSLAPSTSMGDASRLFCCGDVGDVFGVPAPEAGPPSVLSSAYEFLRERFGDDDVERPLRALNFSSQLALLALVCTSAPPTVVAKSRSCSLISASVTGWFLLWRPLTQLDSALSMSGSCFLTRGGCFESSSESWRRYFSLFLRTLETVLQES
jgi:hypothetical protein